MLPLLRDYLQGTAAPSGEALGRKINQSYYALSERYHDGVSNNWFTFAVWGSYEVVNVVRAIKDDFPEMAAALIDGMENMYLRVLSDADVVAVALEDTACWEQTRLQPYLERAFADVDPVWITSVIKTTYPNEVLWVSERVPGTQGDIGAPVENWLEFDQRWPWILGSIRTHLHDESLRANPLPVTVASPWGV